MKPEPLNDKTINHNDGYGCLHYDRDIQAAIEWQRIEDEKVFNDFRYGRINLLTMIQRIGNNRVLSFEDVVK